MDYPLHPVGRQPFLTRQRTGRRRTDWNKGMNMKRIAAQAEEGERTRSELITDRLRTMILEGAFAEDLRLPPERELAGRFGVHRITIAKALHSLASEGYISRRVGSGTYVNAEALQAKSALSVVNVLLPFPSDDTRQGSVPLSATQLLGGPGIAEMVYDYFRSRNVKTAVSFFRGTQELAELIAGLAAEQNAAHIIWYLSSEQSRAALQRLQHAGQLFCLVDSYEPSVPCNFVGTDNRLGGRMQARLLLQAGHRRILLLNISEDDTSVRERRDGFCEEVQAEGGIVRELVWRPDLTAARLGRELRQDKITALAACKDLLALEAVRTLAEDGWRIPEDLSVAGFDGLAAARFCTPALTTIRQAFDTIGMVAAGMVDRQWRSPIRTCETQLVTPSVLTGGSILRR